MTAYASLERLAPIVPTAEAAEPRAIRQRRASLRLLVGRTIERLSIPSSGAEADAVERHDESECASVTRIASHGSILEEASDEQLLTQYRRGNEAAFRTLYRRYYQKARALALNLTRDDNDACEIAQEAFVRVLRKWTHFEGQSAFYTWLYRIVHNLSIDCLRRPYRRRVPIEHVEQWIGDLTPLGLPATQTADPFEACATTEIGRQIAFAVEGLSRHHRAVIVMREVYGMSYSEMSEALGCSKGTIMSRLFHARRRLQDLLRPVMDEDEGEADEA